MKISNGGKTILLATLICAIIILVSPSLCFGKDYTIKIENPIKATSIPELIKSVTKWILGVAGSIMMIVLIFAGFRYMTAGGNEERATQAKNMLKWTVIGIAVVIGSAAIVNGLIAAFGG